jgi:transcriptional regulator with XRE-family HTH domain
MLGDERREFGAHLRRLRKSRNLTLRKLAEKSRVPFPNISAIECGRLGAGRIVATKLASGLGLRGREKGQFLGYASYTNSRDRLAKEHLAYPAVLANLLPGLLRTLGVKAGQIARTFWADSEVLHYPSPEPVEPSDKFRTNPAIDECLQKVRDDAIVVVVVLKSGRQIAISCAWRIF